MRRLRSSVVVIGLAGVMVAGVGLPASGTTNRSRSHFVLYEVATSLAVIDETPLQVFPPPPAPLPQGTGAGDQLIIESDVFAQATYAGGTFQPVGDPIGTLQGICTFVHYDAAADDRTAQCDVSLLLPEGQIVYGGLLDVDALEAAQPVTVPVLGGTGDYRRARGELVLQQPSIQAYDRFRITADLR